MYRPPNFMHVKYNAFAVYNYHMKKKSQQIYDKANKQLNCNLICTFSGNISFLKCICYMDRNP